MVEKVAHHEQNSNKTDRKTVHGTYGSLFESGETGFHLSNSALQGVQLYSVLAAYRLPMGRNSDCIRARFRKKEISYSAIYLHFSHWSHDGSLKKVWQQSISMIQEDLNLSELNLDGTHSLAKKGGQSVAYQGRKKGKTISKSRYAVDLP